MSERLFIGMVPDQVTCSRIARIAEVIGPKLGEARRAVRPGRYHVTLRFLGAYPRVPGERIAAALTALQSTAASPFAISLDEVISFPGAHRRPCVLRPIATPDALRACWRVAGEAFQAAEFHKWLSPHYAPHLTMFYADVGLDSPLPVEPVRFAVRELCLMHSVPGEAEYRVLGRRELSAAV